jgi:phage FluMu protein Com
MSCVRCGTCSLIVEASPRPPRWRCPNCRSLNEVGYAPVTPMILQPRAAGQPNLAAKRPSF